MKYLNKFYQLLFCVFIFLLPTQLAYHFWPDWALVFGIRVDYLAPAIYLTDILALVLFVLYYRNNPLPKVPLWLIVFILINIWVSNCWQISLLKWLKMGELYLLAYMVAKDKSLEVIKPLKYSVIFFTCLGIVQFVLGHTIGGPFYYLGERTFNISTPGISLVNIFNHTFLKPYSTFSHPNSMAGFLGVCLLLFIMFKKKLSAIFSLLGVVFTFSLGAAIGLIFRKIPVYFLFLFVLISLLMPAISSGILNLNYPENISDRLILFISAGKIFSQHFLWGVGLNNFILELPRVMVDNRMVWLLQPVHNIFSLVVVETGLVGLIIFSVGLYKLIKRASPKYLGIIIFIILTGMFDHYWLTLQQNLLLASVVIGLSFRDTSIN